MPWAAFVRLLLLMFVLGAIAAFWLLGRPADAVIVGDPPVAECPASSATAV